MWFFYVPDRGDCPLAANDVVEIDAAVSPSAEQSEGRYPEYDKIWSDDLLRAVVIIGKDKPNSESRRDHNIAGYNKLGHELLGSMLSSEPYSDLQITLRERHGGAPNEVPSAEVDNWVGSGPADYSEWFYGGAGASYTDVTFTATAPDGRSIEVVLLLVSSLHADESDGYFDELQEFKKRYGELTPNADFIVYNGHSSYGTNIRTLIDSSVWRAGQYTIMMLNGCDTYAYADTSLADAHAELNPDDPNGTKYFDLVMNAKVSRLRKGPGQVMVFISALLDYVDPARKPLGYHEILEQIDESQLVLVTGEQDNAYQP